MSSFEIHKKKYELFKKDAENKEIKACTALSDIHINKHQNVRKILEENENIFGKNTYLIWNKFLELENKIRPWQAYGGKINGEQLKKAEDIAKITFGICIEVIGFRKKNSTKMQKEFKDMVFEFAKSVSDFESVKAAVIFGSVAKGKADKKSDIDILVMFNTTGKRFKDEDNIFSLSQELGKKYDKIVQIVFSDRNFDGLDRKFIEAILKEGIVIYGNIPSIKTAKLYLEPYSIFNFEINKLNKNTRNKLNRILVGYETRKRYKSKIYKSSSEGLIKKYEYIKLGSSSLIVPFTSLDIFEELFKTFKIKYKKLDVWIPMI